MIVKGSVRKLRAPLIVLLPLNLNDNNSSPSDLYIIHFFAARIKYWAIPREYEW